MEHLTPSESDRIIQACLDASQNPMASLIAAWRAMMLQMLERLDLGVHRAQVVAIARDIVELWSGVQLARTHDPDCLFRYPFAELWRLRDTYGELKRLGIVILLEYPDLPPRPQAESESASRRIGELMAYVDRNLARLDKLDRNMDFLVRAGEMIEVQRWCRTLLAIVLGPEHDAAFTGQHDACVGSWDAAAKLIDAKPVGGIQ